MAKTKAAKAVGTKTKIASKENSVFSQVYKIVLQIPKGKVLTYGTISNLIGRRLTAQGVGWALNALPERPKKGQTEPPFHSGNIPWHRVINSKGGISTSRHLDMPADLQRKLLEAEGIKFDDNNTIELHKYLWTIEQP